MKNIKNLTLSLLLACMGGVTYAQTGLEGVVVEKYYISNAADATGSIGALPAGSVTYRVFADMLPGYNFQALYGVGGHTLTINTSTSFFNNEDRGATTPSFNAVYLHTNSVALDSWFSVGGAANGQMGILKSEDDGLANLITSDPILMNTDPDAGIPLTTQDGIVTGSPVSVTFVGLSGSDLNVFNGTSMAGNSFTTSNGSIAALGGAVGPVPATNKVLIGQFTTNGTFHFELNIQIGTPSGGTENYVATSPVAGEFSIPSLIYTSTPAAPAATATISYCMGSTATPLTATASPTCTLNWYTVPTSGSASTTAPTPSTAAAGTTTYYVSQMNGGGNESARTPITVTVNPLPAVPTISASGSTSFCTGGSVVLTSSASTGNTWSTTATTNSVTVTTTGNYTVTETDLNGCSSTSVATAVDVSSAPLPTVAASGATTLCAGQSVVLTASTSDTYLWSPGGQTTQSITVTAAGTYHVTTTNAVTCSGVGTSANTTVAVNPVPTAAGTIVSTVGSVVTFSNTSTGATTYNWNFGDASYSTSTAPVHAYAANGTYTVTLVASNGTCSDTTTFMVTMTVGISEIQTLSGISIYPNPANDQATISVNLTAAAKVVVNVYDVTGKIVASVFDGTMNTGVTNLTVDASKLTAGIYFATVVSETSKKTLKMVVIK